MNRFTVLERAKRQGRSCSRCAKKVGPRTPLALVRGVVRHGTACGGVIC